ncbi:MAG: RIP metalloprotease RseP [Bacilli bacterium]
MTLIYFILILGITVCIHEFGHFYFAKKSGVYVYEFSIGMGPVIKQWKRKNDETVYSIRLFPIGGYVSMAGEQVDDDDKVPSTKRLYNKTWGQRFITIAAGIILNFVLAIVLFFLLAVVTGTPSMNGYVTSLEKSMPAYNSGLKVGDKILKLNKKNINADMIMLDLMVNKEKEITLTVEHENNKIEHVKIKPKKTKEGSYKFGFGIGAKEEKGFLAPFKYAFEKTWSLLKQMVYVITYLCTGQISFNSLSGPVGIYEVVGETAKAGFASLVYLLAYISLNVGFMNLLPIPAFDGGRLLFLIIEKVKGSPVNPKIENIIHSIGLFLLLGLMVVITYNDIVRIFFGG